MRFPDLFILGAPKCGTTSLHGYLDQHPRMFMSYPKEPNYYNSDVPLVRKTETRDAYLALFRNAPADSVAGEATASMLYSRVAVPRILNDNPRAKFIVCLRSPADMFVSYHGQLLFDRHEKISDLEQAWRASLARCDKRDEKPLDLLDYAGMCSLGAQVQRLLGVAERSSVQFILFDDIAADTRGVYERMLAFLGLPDDGRTEFTVHNWRKTHRFPRLRAFIMRPPFPLDHVRRGIVKLVRRKWKNPSNIYDSMLSKPAPRPVLREEFRNELVAYFDADVRLLESLIGRDLAAWRR
jgi:hypothetical protein